MVGGIRYEHTHRVIASLVGLLTIVLNLWLWRKESRRWVRRLGLFALVAVIVQGILGGITVLFFLPAPVSILHAVVAQTFFCSVVAIAVVTGKRRGIGIGDRHQFPSNPFVFSTFAIFLQLILGATLRHGGMLHGNKGEVLVVPALIAHLVGAALVLCLTLYALVQVLKKPGLKHLLAAGYFVAVLLFLQLFLGVGAYAVRVSALGQVQRPLAHVLITTAHLAVGALLLATSLIIALGKNWGPTPISRFSGKLVSVPNFSNARIHAYLELTKPRVTLLVVLTTAAAFYLASSSHLNWALLFHTLLGTALLAAGAAVLNQVIERDADAKMRRTEGRPLPSGRVHPKSATYYGLLLAATGTIYLALAANSVTALVGFITCVVYLFVYTPLKSKTTLCTLVGAFPGAAPPLLGWTAVRGNLDFEALALFAILFLWQFPHFLAISWLYKEDYERGGFAMLPVIDSGGCKTGRRIVAYSVALLPVSLVPGVIGLTGSTYLLGALLSGVVFLQFGIGAAMSGSKNAARQLLRASVVYLPLLLFLMVIDKS